MDNHQKVLSISIAAYNVEKTIERALDSLLIPSILEDIEIFVVDDGGKDETLHIAEKYAEKYPNTIFPVHKENGGYGSTINCSVARATGKYFKQLDGDDWFLSDNLVEFVNVLKKTDADFVITEVADFNEITKEQTVNYRLTNLTAGLHLFEDTKLDSLLTMHGSTIRTSLLQKNGIHIIEKCFYSDTELVVFPLLYAQSFYVWAKPLYVYLTCSEGQSMSLTGIKKHYPDHEKVFAELVDTYKKIPSEDQNKKEQVYQRIKKEALIHFRFLLRMEICIKHYQELKSFGDMIKAEMPELYKDLYQSLKKMKLMWDSKYLAYPIISLKIKKELNK